uniref:Patatin family protein n=1 Tax=uncultured Prevotella sp. TaxID=159272 RepID=A0A6G8F1G8_9BACT|nr:patatin family protein [uncultured Prevotella sp.]
MKKGLVLEGGGMRGMFTAGVMDAFMEEELSFDGIIGVSAGALFGCNYKSRQQGRALRYNIKLKNDPHYMGWKTFFKTGNIVNPQFSYHVVPFVIDKFDSYTFDNNPTEFWVVCTDIITGKPVYHRMDAFTHRELEWMRASASMPAVSRPVFLDGRVMLDGGITDSIPLQAFQNLGYGRNVVILTQPNDYFKKPMKIAWLIKLMTKKYPKVGECMARRHEMYNRQLEYLMQQERAGNTLLIYPEKALGIGRTELNEKKMRRVHNMGYTKAKEIMPLVKDFITH